MKLTLLAAALAIGAAGTVQAQSDPAGLRATPAQLRAQLDRAAPGWLAETQVPSVAVALIADGKVAWTEIYGD